MRNTKWPATLEDAVTQTLSVLSAKAKNQIAKMPEEETIMLHMSLGVQIRNSFGLHQGNKALLTSCDCMDSDDASGVIIKAVVKAVKAECGK